MSCTRKKYIIKLASILKDATYELDKNISNGIVPGFDLLGDMQSLAINIGNSLDTRPEYTDQLIHKLEDYCELLYQMTREADSISDCRKTSKKLLKLISSIVGSLEYDLKDDKKTVVFLPYNASMWDSLESVWKAADEDPDCDALVVPIPYYDRNPDASLGKMYYEGERYPEYVPITDYRQLDLEKLHPDMIYIHNPYDDVNYVTTIDPAFYSERIKNFTDCLVYIPYYIFGPGSADDEKYVSSIERYCTTPGVIHSHKVIVQSEEVRAVYIKVLTKEYGEQSRKYWEDKIYGTGSPKLDRINDFDIENIPNEWKKIIYKEDGTKKKVIFYNTSLHDFLKNDKKYVEKMENTFITFFDMRDEVSLLWRPHPLMESTLGSLRADYLENYLRVKKKFEECNWGILDESSDLHRAIAVSDAYYGDHSSVVYLCEAAGKPCMIQNVDILN